MWTLTKPRADLGWAEGGGGEGRSHPNFSLKFCIIFKEFSEEQKVSTLFPMFVSFPVIRNNKFPQIKITVNIFPAKIYSE